MNKYLLSARLLLQTMQHGNVPYSLPGIPGPNGMPREHIVKAVSIVSSASVEDRRKVNKAILRTVYNIDEYGKRIY